MRTEKKATIAESGTESGEIVLGTDQDGFGISHIECPSNLRGIASLKVEGSYDDGTTWKIIADETGTDFAVTPVASRIIQVPPAKSPMVPPKFRLKPDSAPTGGSVVFNVVLRSYH